jgi:oligopeptide transport system permease protein
MGGSKWRILFKHLLPHTFGVVFAHTMMNLPAILILEATLSYLGLGVQPPQASLGVLLKEGAEAMTVFPWLIWGPVLVFVWMLSTIYILGEKLKAKAKI